MTDSFADAPKTIGEIRSDREHSGRAWEPRDALISALRDIDSGELKAVDMVITYTMLDENGVLVCGQYLSYKNKLALIGATEKTTLWMAGADE